MGKIVRKANNTLFKAGSKIYSTGDDRGPVSLFNNTTSLPGAVDGQPVSIWRDVSGSNNHLRQVGVTQNPLYKANSNGLACIDFDGTNDFLRMTLGFPATTVFFVARWKVVQERHYFDHASNPIYYWITQNGYWFRYAGDVPGTFGNNSMQANSGNKIWKNGLGPYNASQVTADTSWTLICFYQPDGKQINGIGGSPTNGGSFPYVQIQFAHLEIYDYRLTALNRENKMLELKAQYGIA